MKPNLILDALRNPHHFTATEQQAAYKLAADLIEFLTRDNLLRRLHEVALTERILKLEAEASNHRHDLVNANFALSLLKGTNDEG